MGSVRNQIAAAGAAIAAAGFKAGAEWDRATKTIVDGTGATGKALQGLLVDYRAVARYGPRAAAAIADLNTHLGLQGAELRMVAEAALKAKVDTNLFGDVAAQMGLDAQGTVELLDQLVAASQATGVGVDQMTKMIGRNSARWQAAGGSMADLTAITVQAADEFGPSGLRGAMTEILEAVDQGVMPSITSLTDQLGDTTGAVERTYEAGKTWRDTLRETKDAALAYIGPAGDMLGVLGSTVTTLVLAGPQMLKWVKGIKLGAIANAVWASSFLPVTIAIAAVFAAWKIGNIEGVKNQIAEWTLRLQGFSKAEAEAAVAATAAGVAAREQAEATAAAIDPTEALDAAIRDAETSTRSLIDGLVDADKEVDTFTGTIEDQSASLDHWSSQLDGVGIAVKPIPPLIWALNDAMKTAQDRTVDLSTSIEAQAATFDHWGIPFDAMGIQLDKLPPKLDETEQSSEQLDVTLAALAGQMGGASGQAINLFQSMLKTNDALKEGEKGFNNVQKGAVLVSAGFHAIGDAIGGTAGKVLSELGNIASAFATGGIVGGIMAGIGSLVKGIAGLFSRGRRKREAAAKAARLAAEEAAARAAEIAAAQKSYWDSVYGSAINAYDRATAAGVDAYDEIYLAAIESGVGQEEAIAKATAAQIDASEKILAAEGEKFARMAAFEAALEAIRSGNAAGAADAAVQAAAETRTAWETAMAAVKVADQAATDSMIQTGEKLAAIQKRQAAEVARARTDAARMAREAEEMYIGGGWGGDEEYGGYGAGGFEYRQHGGPVRAGRSYLVGEAGPEVFIPGRSGSIVSNKGIPSAEEIGAAVAVALHRVPLVVPRDAVTDTVLATSPSRRALKGYT